MKTPVWKTPFGAVAALAATVLIAGCGLNGPAAEPLTGPTTPAEFGLSVTLTATPDQLPRDGSSQSTILVLVRDAQGKPVSGQRLSVGSSVGSVSQSDVVTNADGRATFTFTAPPAGTVGNSALVQVTPVGGSSSTVGRTVSILLLGISNTGAPVPAFTFTPAAPERLQRVTFDATTTTDEGKACSDACTYSWNFDGEATATGRITAYSFQQARIYVVTLTVVDASGSAAGLSQNVTVVNPAVPTASFTVSPSSPGVLQTVKFDASASTAASGHTVSRYLWSFGDVGDGSTDATTAPTTTHAYARTGTYTATLTVRDDVGQERSTTQSITVVAGLTATFTKSPTNPSVADTVQFNASSSTTSAGANITKYQWDFGDGTTAESTSSATASRKYDLGGGRIYTVRLTITDSLGRVATFTDTVTVTG